MHPGVYPYLANSTEFLMYTRRCLAGSVLIGRRRSVFTGYTSIRNGSCLGFPGSRRSSSGINLRGVPRMLFEKTGSAASCRGSLLTVLQHKQRVLRTFIDAQEDTVQKLVCDLNLLLARFPMLQTWLVDETHAETHAEMQ